MRCLQCSNLCQGQKAINLRMSHIPGPTIQLHLAYSLPILFLPVICYVSGVTARPIHCGDEMQEIREVQFL